jgi:hypothetical protein
VASGVIVGGVNVGGAPVSVGAGEDVSWVRVGDGAGLAVRGRVGLGDAVGRGDEDRVAFRVGDGVGAMCVAGRRDDGESAVDGSGAGDTATGESDEDGDDATAAGVLLPEGAVSDQAINVTPASSTPPTAAHAHRGTSRRV